ncbi:mannose-6-phosphate isomerase [Enterococcus faecium]|uniref:mannose-6-phosphate isomerase n=1 Tax=Enterococcus TaxID=1350 RepID=UPI003134566F
MKARADLRRKPRHVKYFPGCSRELLCRCKYFETERICVNKGFSFSVLESSFQVLMCTEGIGGIETPTLTKVLRFNKGDTIFIPAGMGRCHIIGDATLLKIRC